MQDDAAITTAVGEDERAAADTLAALMGSHFGGSFFPQDPADASHRDGCGLSRSGAADDAGKAAVIPEKRCIDAAAFSKSLQPLFPFEKDQTADDNCNA